MSRDNDRDLSDDLNGPYVESSCVDCGRDVVTDCDPDGALCDECDDKRERWAVQTERRMAKAVLPARQGVPVLVDVAIVPRSERQGVVEVALIPTNEIAIIQRDDQDGLRRMATAVLAADLTTIKDVA